MQTPLQTDPVQVLRTLDFLEAIAHARTPPFPFMSAPSACTRHDCLLPTLSAVQLCFVLFAIVASQPSAAMSSIVRAEVLPATISTSARAVAPAPADAGGSVPHAGTMAVPLDTSDADREETIAVDAHAKVTIYRADTPKNFDVGLRLRPTSGNARGGVALRLVPLGSE